MLVFNGQDESLLNHKDSGVINKLLKKSTTLSGESMTGKLHWRNKSFSTEIICFYCKTIEDITYFHDTFWQLTIMTNCWFIKHLWMILQVRIGDKIFSVRVICNPSNCHLTLCFVSQNSERSVYRIWFARGLINYTYFFL